MKIAAVVILSCVLWEVKGYPYYPYYGSIDTLSYGASDNRRGGMVLNRYYNPYFTPQVGGGMAAFMFKQPEEAQPSQYYLADRRRQTPQDESYPQPPQQPNYPQTPQENIYPQQENEVYYPVIPNKPTQPPTAATDIAEPTEKTEIISSTVQTVVPELVEPEVEEVEQKPRKVSKKKLAKRPVQDEEVDDERPEMPGGSFFPMFFGWGRNGGAPGGATAIANAYSTGRGGVATSHATAYGMPQPELRNIKNYKNYQQQD
ncbi:hypothetical protein O0L34_g14775 [Tuta absoluta]|nr:hypothetical protein O0L34_g14775 [Tuta absoluta]